MSLSAGFVSIECQHIYREANVAVDQLSKEALGPTTGSMHFSEFRDGLIVEQGSISTF